MQAHELVVCTDHYSEADKSLFQKIGKQLKVRIIIQQLPDYQIRNIVEKNKFNVTFDAIITRSESIRKYLKENNLLSVIETPTSFQKLQRQFYNTHHLWLPISHDPLLIVQQKDSLHPCGRINWTQIKRDSLSINFQVRQDSAVVRQKINHSKKLSSLLWTYLHTNQALSLQQLAELATQKKVKPACRYYLFENHQQLTTVSSISLYRYSRNKTITNQFIKRLSGYSYQLASNRNQLSTFKNVQPNFNIQRLEIK